jgi:hypothetical protein
MANGVCRGGTRGGLSHSRQWLRWVTFIGTEGVGSDRSREPTVTVVVDLKASVTS